jgi:hypothetical protein
VEKGSQVIVFIVRLLLVRPPVVDP